MNKPQYTAPDLSKILTIYGRKAVLEALESDDMVCGPLHVATSNKASRITEDIVSRAQKRGIQIREHSRNELSRISKNGKQDQGVALDISCPNFGEIDDVLEHAEDPSFRLMALDGITNPQNVGMIIRSAAAAGIDGIIYPRKGVAALGPLVIKASVGSVFRAPLLRADSLLSALTACQQAGFSIATLEGAATTDLFHYQPTRATIYVLGGETDGVSKEVSRVADTKLSIPMANGVESLNVAVAASLVGYASRII